MLSANKNKFDDFIVRISHGRKNQKIAQTKIKGLSKRCILLSELDPHLTGGEFLSYLTRTHVV